MSEDIKVSVLVYVFNNKKYIEKSIRSVMNQTLKEIEILVIDGGSTDGTLQIVDKLAKEDKRLRVIYSKSGVGLQFNTGLLKAKGEYIGICESDDYLLPDMYEKQYKLVKQNDLDILRADARHFVEDWNNNEITFLAKLSKQDVLYNQVLDLTKDQSILKLGINSFWSGLYRKEFLLSQELFMNETKGAAYQDISFLFLCAIKAKRVMLSEDAFYCYRLDNPMSSVNHPQKITMLIEEYRLLKKRLVEDNLFEKYKEIYFSWKINSYLGFYYSLSEKRQKDFAELMYQDIKLDISLERYSGEGLSKKEYLVVNAINHSVEKLYIYLQETYDTLENTENELKDIENNIDIVIFGSGDIGKLVSLYMLYSEKSVVAYADNNEILWGKELNQIPILKPERAVCLYPKAIYIVANETYFCDMRNQLLQISIDENNIIICNDYNFFLKHILIKKLKDRG